MAGTSPAAVFSLGSDGGSESPKLAGSLPTSFASQQPMSPTVADASGASSALSPGDAAADTATEPLTTIILTDSEDEPAAASRPGEGSEIGQRASSRLATSSSAANSALAPAAAPADQASPLTDNPLFTAAPSATSMLMDAMAAQQPADASVKVYVRDPQKHDLSRMGVVYSYYFDYLVRTEAPGWAGACEPQEGQQPGVWEVRRRFSDFDVLHRLLKARYKGFIVPALPDKAFFESRFVASDSFVKVRTVDLAAFTRGVTGHPVLRDCEEARLFLTAPDLAACTQWRALAASVDHLRGLLGGGGQQAAASEAGASDLSRMPSEQGEAPPVAQGASSSPRSSRPPAAAGAGFMSLFKHAVRDIGGLRSGGKAPAVELGEEEQQLRQALAGLKELQQHLNIACTMARNLAGRFEELTDDFSDLGRSFAHMARWEEAGAQRSGQYTPAGRSASQRAEDLQVVGYTSLRMHNLLKQWSLRTAASLVFLHDYLVLVPEAIAALQEREAALSRVASLQEEVADKQAALTRLEAQTQSAAALRDPRRIVQLQASIKDLQERTAAGKEHYKLLLGRNQAELARLNLKRATDFRQALCNFASVQAQLYQAAAEVWASVGQHYSGDAAGLDALIA